MSIRTAMTQSMLSASTLLAQIVENLTSMRQSPSSTQENTIITNAIRSYPTCAYTDHNLHCTPERLAQLFKQQHFRTWLLNNPYDSIFSEKETTAVHIMLRCEDIAGITHLAKQGYPLSIIEPASYMSCIGLLCNMESLNQSRVFRDWQKKRACHPKRDHIFRVLCKLDTSIDLSSLVHIVMSKQSQSLIWDAATAFYKQNNPDALHELQVQMQQKECYDKIESFNQHMVKISLEKDTKQPHSTLKRQYTTKQLSKIQAHMAQRITRAMYHAALKNTVKQPSMPSNIRHQDTVKDPPVDTQTINEGITP